MTELTFNDIFTLIREQIDKDPDMKKDMLGNIDKLDNIVRNVLAKLYDANDYFKLSKESNQLFIYIIEHFICYAFAKDEYKYLSLDSLIDFVLEKTEKDFTDMINSYKYMDNLYENASFSDSVQELKDNVNLIHVRLFMKKEKISKLGTPIENMLCNVDMSIVPEFEISLIKRYLDDIELDSHETAEHFVGATYPTLLCNYSQSFRYSNNVNKKLKKVWSPVNISESNPCGLCNMSDIDRTDHYCYKSNTGFCRPRIAVAYKWLDTYNKDYLKRQREKYLAHKDEIDSKYLINAFILKKTEFPQLTKFPEDVKDLPFVSSEQIADIRRKIDNGELYCSPNIEDKKYFFVYRLENDEIVQYKYTISDYEQYIDNNVTESDMSGYQFMFILTLLMTDLDLYNKYLEHVKAHETEIPAIKGNSYYGYVAGNDRDEVRTEVMKLVEGLVYNFNLKEASFTKITATDLMYQLASWSYVDGPLEYKRLEENKIYLITGLKEFTKLKLGSDSSIYNFKDRQTSHLIKQLRTFNDNIFIILAGQKSEIDDFLALDPALKIIFEQNVKIIDDKTNEELYDIFIEKVKNKSKIELTEENKKDFINYVAYNRGSFPFDNSTLAKYLANFTISREEFVLPTNLSILKEQNFMKELDNLVGMEQIKKQVRDLYDFVRYRKAAEEQNISIGDGNLHMIFTGNPGTGKTTVARILAKALYDIGIIKENKLVEVEAKDLIGQYVGHTAPKTQEVIDKAMGGVLFVDEAYSITGGSLQTIHGNHFGDECIATLITAMENHKGDFICIFAGYKLEMEKFIDSNPGLRSRIGYVFHFDDYTIDDLMEIFNRKMAKSNLVVDPACEPLVRDVIQYFAGARNIGNGRFINKLYQIIIQNKAKLHDEDIKKITPECIPSIQDIIDILPEKEDLVSPDRISEESKLRVTYHELGHALIHNYFGNTVKGIKVIVSANGSLGYTQLDNNKIVSNKSEQEYREYICAAMGGVAAEQVMLGSYSAGGTSDFDVATKAVKSMIANGLSSYKFAGLYMINTNANIANEINKIIQEEFDRAVSILTTKKDKIEEYSKVLLEKGIIEDEELAELLK